MYKIKYAVLTIIVSTLLYALSNCTQPTVDPSSMFLNMHDSVQLVGMQTCRSCHSAIYDSYIQTGMGQSFGIANRTKTAASFEDKDVVYDQKLDLYYRPFFRDSVMYVLEFRLKGKDTVHQREERIDYIIGSGHHTNSHMMMRNGYLHQAPITYYTQDKKWDLAPGYDQGANLRFGRAILSECITCHNHLPVPASGAENKYHQMPLGIACERCHGAGSLHVQEKLKGNIVDTSKYIDYTIVNPRNLSIDRQMDLCQRCHLQGVAVLNEGKTFYDFKPGMKLSDVMNIYLPRFTDSDKRFIMASQADRLKQSNCFKVSGQLSCINCHNPHHDVHSISQNRYNESCNSCHHQASNLSQLLACSAPAASLKAKGNDCVSCHMPPSGSIDIPHVNITDHYISRHNIYQPNKDTITSEKKEEIAGFLGLKSLVLPQTSDLQMARAYLALWDKFMASEAILDSAKFYLDRSLAPRTDKLNTLVHYYFNKQEYALLVSVAPLANTIKKPWTAYRIGEAASKMKQLAKATDFYKRAADLLPYNLNFQEKLGTNYAQIQLFKKAEKVFEFILKEDPKRKKSLSNLGLIKAQKGRLNEALKFYDKALASDPDYNMALLNKIGVLIQLNRKQQAQTVINHLIDKHPEYRTMLQKRGLL